MRFQNDRKKIKEPKLKVSLASPEHDLFFTVLINLVFRSVEEGYFITKIKIPQKPLKQIKQFAHDR